MSWFCLGQSKFSSQYLVSDGVVVWCLVLSFHAGSVTLDCWWVWILVSPNHPSPWASSYTLRDSKQFLIPSVLVQPKGELIELWTSAEIQLLQLCPTSWVPAPCWCPARWAVPGWVCVSAGSCSHGGCSSQPYSGHSLTLLKSEHFLLSYNRSWLWKSVFFPQIPQASKIDFGHFEFPLDSFWSTNLHSFIAVGNFPSWEACKSCTARQKHRANPLLF